MVVGAAESVEHGHWSNSERRGLWPGQMPIRWLLKKDTEVPGCSGGSFTSSCRRRFSFRKAQSWCHRKFLVIPWYNISQFVNDKILAQKRWPPPRHTVSGKQLNKGEKPEERTTLRQDFNPKTFLNREAQEPMGHCPLGWQLALPWKIALWLGKVGVSTTIFRGVIQRGRCLANCERGPKCFNQSQSSVSSLKHHFEVDGKCVFVCVCVCVCTYVCACICMYLYVCVHVPVHVPVQVLCVCECVWMCECVCVCV